MNQPDPSIGCSLYGIGALGFTICVLLMMISFFFDKRAHRAKNLPFGHMAKTSRRSKGLFAVAIASFLLGIGVEFVGAKAGLFAGQTSCPGPTPRSLRALNT